MGRSTRTWMLLGLFALVPSPAMGDELPADDPVQRHAPAISSDALARRLDADTFSERQLATEQLRDRGAHAHEVLEEVARRGSAEARSRALQILQEQLQSTDLDLQSAARRALENISGGTGPAARSAYSILHPAPPPENLAMRRMPIRVAAIRPQLAPAVRRYSITVNENGRVIRVTGSEKGIDVEITETDANGRKVTEKFHGKDEKELAEKHPNAHKIFQDFSQRFGIRGPHIVEQNPAPPLPLPKPDEVLPPQQPQRPADVIERSQQVMRDRLEQLRKQQAEAPDEGRARTIEAMERHMARLEQVKAQLQQ
jgi:hypothetical protein